MIIIAVDEDFCPGLGPDVVFQANENYKILLYWLYKMSIDVSKVCLYDTTCEDLSFWIKMAHDNLKTINFISIGQSAKKNLSSRDIKESMTLPRPDSHYSKKELVKQLKRCKEWLNE